MDITIRHAEPGDYEAVSRIFSGPKAVAGTLQVPLASAEVWRQRMADPSPSRVFLLACAEGEVVGQLGLISHPNVPRRAHVGDLGMAVRDDWQGKGVGTALMQAAVNLADRWLNLHRLELQVYTDNEAGIRLYKKFGFVVEGTLKDFAFRDGKYVDAYAMARLRP
jgi:L-phenylalanine/L-methionine N-acetyltransferase